MKLMADARAKRVRHYGLDHFDTLPLLIATDGALTAFDLVVWREWAGRLAG